MSQAGGNAPLIRAVDLFCGVGGLTHGLERGGVDVAAGYDLDPACRVPYESNNRARFIESDVATLDASDVEGHLRGADFTLIAGCAPCQPFSTYSRAQRSKKRPDDWRLVKAFGSLIASNRPDFVTMENVPQLRDHPVFDDFMAYLDGYSVWHDVVDCAALGVPQSRRRLVLIASRHGAEGLSMPASGFEPQTVRGAISGLTPLAAGQADPLDPVHAASRLSELNLRRIKASTPGGSWRDWDPSLLSECHKRSSGATYPSVYGRMEWDAPAPTITTQCFGYGNGRFGHPEQDRAISLREAAMLQTFPRSYRFVEDGEAVRFNRLGRLIGNAVPVRLGEVVASVLRHHAGLIQSGPSLPAMSPR